MGEQGGQRDYMVNKGDYTGDSGITQENKGVTCGELGGTKGITCTWWTTWGNYHYL